MGQAAPARLEVRIEGLRNQKGLIRLCVTRDEKIFPNCERDPAARSLSVPATAASEPIEIPDLRPGDCAVAVFHDENGNGKLDTAFAIPKEGFGFSNNPTVRFGAPSYAAVRIRLVPGANTQTIKLLYIL